MKGSKKGDEVNPYMQHVPKLDLRGINQQIEDKESKVIRCLRDGIIDGVKPMKQSIKGVKKEAQDGTGWLCPKKLPSDLENVESMSLISFKIQKSNSHLLL